MQPYVPADCVQVDLTFLLDGQRCQNVLHYAFDGAPLPPDMVELGEEIITTVNGTYKTFLPTTMSLTEVKITDLRTQISPSVFATAGLPVVGTNVSPALPNNCAMVVTKRTLFRGRSYRGRIYQMGLVEAQVTNNAVSPTYQANYMAFWEVIRHIDTTTVAWDMVVLSRRQAGNWLPEGIVTPVEGFTTDGLVDSQRRRLPGRGS